MTDKPNSTGSLTANSWFVSTVLVNLVPTGIVLWLLCPQFPPMADGVAVVVALLYCGYLLSPYVAAMILAKLVAKARYRSICIFLTSLVGFACMASMAIQGFDADRAIYFVFMPVLQWLILLSGCAIMALIGGIESIRKRLLHKVA